MRILADSSTKHYADGVNALVRWFVSGPVGLFFLVVCLGFIAWIVVSIRRSENQTT